MNRTFRIKNPALYLDYNDWESSFPIFYEAVMLQYELGKIEGGIVFSDSHNNYNLHFTDTSIRQIATLKKICQSRTLLNNLLKSESSEFRNQIKLRSKNILAQTLSKLRILKSNLEPAGYEPLKYHPYSTYKARSLESYGRHRIIYNLNELPYRLVITSVLGHYKNEPEDYHYGLELKIERSIIDLYQIMSSNLSESEYNGAINILKNL